MLCSPRLLSPEYPDHPHWLLASCPPAQSRQSENPTTSRPCSKSLHGSPWPQIKTHVGLAQSHPCLLRHGPPFRPHLSPPLLPTPTRDAGLPLDAPGSRLFPRTFLCPLSFFSFGRTQSYFSFKTQLRRPFSRSLSWTPTPSPRYSSVVVCTSTGFFTLSLC